MKLTTLCLGAIVAGSCLLSTTSFAAEEGKRRPVRDTKEITKDRADQRQDARDLAKDKAGERRDARDLAKDKVAGDDAAVAKDRKDLAGDRKDVAGDRKDLAGDRKDLAQDRSDRRTDEVNNRENRQQRRIDQGVAKGSLTPAEVADLEGRENNIKALETQFAGDGKITAAESRELNQALNQTSMAIWADKRNTDGVQQPVSRLGKDVTLNADIAAKLAGPDLSRADARAFSHDFGQITHLRRALASQDLTADQRTAMQNQYNELLGKYFTVATPTTAAASK